jgi:RHS repeat-associated protein
LQANCYDGLHRHVQQINLDETRDYFYSDAWQVLEEDSSGLSLSSSSSSSSPTVVSRQFVWGERYVDDLLLRNRRSLGSLDDSIDEQFYPMSDPNWNVTGIANAAGLIQERFSYDAYGKSAVLTGSFNSCSSSSYTWETRYASYRQDTTSELIYVRSREMHALVGGWLSRDPIGFAGDPQNLYRYVRNRPIDRIDPFGEVEFDITPGKVESMDWYESKLAGGGEVGRTVIVKLAAPWKGQPAECGKKGQVKFTVRAELHIRIDSAEIKKTRFSKAKAYGHEQVHVDNMITIIKREAKVFEDVEAKTFDTPAEANAAAKEAVAAFDKAVHDAYDLDAKHEGKDPMSPPKGGGVQPKGTMPAKPKGTE